jgi:hypothetical protein
VVHFLRIATALGPLTWLLTLMPAQAGDLDPLSPAALQVPTFTMASWCAKAIWRDA